jgi:hypothetical protein
MSERLQELLRQKALLDEHAAWLEREIAAERARTGDRPPAESAPVAPPAASPPAVTDAETDALLDQYRGTPQSLHQEVRRGCLLYFFAALAVVGLGALIIYLAYRLR